MTELDIEKLLASAAEGDQRSWEVLVERYADAIWAVARSFRLSRSDAADVTQATWLRLVEHFRDIREPALLGSWLITTARREAMALIRRADRALPAGDTWIVDVPDRTTEAPEGWVVRSHDAAMVRREFRKLSMSCQQLLLILLAEPAPSYAEVGKALGMPIGSIGPTRARCLGNLRRFLTG